MQIDWLTVAAQIVNFLVLVWLLRRFLYGPITAAMDRREQRIAAKLAETDQRRAEAEAAALSHREAERDLEQRSEQLLAQARKTAEEERHDLEHTAREEVQELRQAWERQLDDEKTVFLGDVRQHLLDHAFALARHTIDDLADRRLEEQMTRAFVDRLEKLDRAARRKLTHATGHNDQAVTVQSRFDLMPNEKSQITKAIHDVIASDAKVTYEPSQANAAGIELRIGSQSVAWTVAGYLDDLERQVESEIGAMTGAEPVRAP